MGINSFGPFQAEVWGTVSDWVMVLVTMLTAYYLYRNLKSQLKITKIEESRHKLSIMPLFDINIEPESTFKIINGKFEINTFFTIKLVNDNIARNFFMFLPDDHSWTYSVPNQNVIKNFVPKDVFNFSASLIGKTILVEEKEIEFGYLNFKIEFTDDINNLYEQVITYTHLDGFKSISISYPENTGNQGLSLSTVYKAD